MLVSVRGKAEAAQNFQNSWLVGVCCFCTVYAIPSPQVLQTVYFDQILK